MKHMNHLFAIFGVILLVLGGYSFYFLSVQRCPVCGCDLSTVKNVVQVTDPDVSLTTCCPMCALAMAEHLIDQKLLSGCCTTPTIEWIEINGTTPYGEPVEIVYPQYITNRIVADGQLLVTPNTTLVVIAADDSCGNECVFAVSQEEALRIQRESGWAGSSIITVDEARTQAQSRTVYFALPPWVPTALVVSGFLLEVFLLARWKLQRRPPKHLD